MSIHQNINDFFRNAADLGNCIDCIKQDVCHKRNVLIGYNSSCCIEKVSTKNIIQLMDETRKKEANDHLNKLCEELLALKRRLDNGERSLDLYIEIMNHEFVDPTKMVEENNDGTK
ncbi:hypothetical protein [Fibrobacter sp.]|uniref:hypothetical protein n=1 Tax=Fibrobacter sp. TaxID=35828 RepID=UPI0038905CDE